MILFFDTETTGFPHTSKPDDHPDQPHIVELAATLTDDDGKFVAGFSTIIDPGVERGVCIPEHVAKIHGIDEERAWRYGVEPDLALTMFDALYCRADLIVAHRVEFDVKMLEIAFGRNMGAWLGAGRIPQRKLVAPQFCTQKAAKEVLGSGSNLAGCYKTFFGEEHTGAHGAAADTDACKRVYFHLKSIGAA